MLNASLTVATDSSGSHTNIWELGGPAPDHIIAVIVYDFLVLKWNLCSVQAGFGELQRISGAKPKPPLKSMGIETVKLKIHIFQANGQM